MFTLIAIAAVTTFMTLAITTLGIAVLTIKDLIVDAPEFMHLRAAGFPKHSNAAVAPQAA